MMKKLAVAVATASTLGFATLAHAEEFDTPIGKIDASMTATLATDYIWRGQSQTAGAGAVQGSLDFAHESGLYIGAWASNVDADAFDASVEIDYYFGWAGNITDEIELDLGWATYTYPKAGGDASVDEVLASIGLYGFTLGAKYAYDPESALYTYIGYGFELPYEFGLDLHYGRTDTKDPLSSVQSKEKYDDWAVTVSKDFVGIDWALMYSDTNLKGGTCSEWYGKSRYCSGNWTFSATKSF